MTITPSLKARRAQVLLVVILLMLLLSACGSRSVLQASSWPGVSVSEDVAFIAFSQFVYSIDLETGRVLWTFPQEADRGSTFYAPPAVSTDGERLVAGSYNQTVYGLNARSATTTPLWVFEEPEDRIIGGPLIVDDTVLVPTAAGRLFALDLTDGLPLWDAPFEAQHALWSTPVVAEDHIYLGGLDHHVYSISLDTGSENWSTDLSSAITDSPTLTDGLLLSGTFGGMLSALDASSGQIEWEFQADDSIWGSPAVSDGTAYFGDVSGMAYALEVQTGRELWRQALSGPASASPVIIGDLVYFVSEVGSMDALERESGANAWPASATMVGRLLADPIPSSEGILVPAMESECLIYSVEPETGGVRCLFSTE